MRKAQKQGWARTEKEITTTLNTDAAAGGGGGDKNIRKRGCWKGFILTNAATCLTHLWGGALSPPFSRRKAGGTETLRPTLCETLVERAHEKLQRSQVRYSPLHRAVTLGSS